MRYLGVKIGTASDATKREHGRECEPGKQQSGAGIAPERHPNAEREYQADGDKVCIAPGTFEQGQAHQELARDKLGHFCQAHKSACDIGAVECASAAKQCKRDGNACKGDEHEGSPNAQWDLQSAVATK